MTTKKKRPESLLDKARSLKCGRQRTWFDDLDADAQAELLELRAAWQAGELSAGVTGLARMIGAALSLSVTQWTIRAWLHAKN